MSTELWFDENDEQLDELRVYRRCLRDASNPLELPEEVFQKNFRLCKIAFLDLLSDVQPYLTDRVKSSAVPKVLKLCSALRFFAHGSYQASVGNDYNIGLAQSTVSLALKEVLNVLEAHICPRFIQFQRTPEEIRNSKIYFFQKSGIPGVIGCIDGSHIKIVAPEKGLQHLYINRKGFFSINAMIVCDHNMVIRYLNAKHPGSTHDSLVFDLSGLKTFLETTPSYGCLLGDAGYALKPYLLTPYRVAEEASNQSLFNRRHATARNIIERTIGVLKNKFRCLLAARTLHYSPKKATQIINACAALHNICRLRNMPDVLPDSFVAEETDPSAADETDSGNTEAQALRNEIASNLV